MTASILQQVVSMLKDWPGASAARCLTAADHGIGSFHTSPVPIPRQAVLTIYERRRRRHLTDSALQSALESFVHHLSTASEDLVRIHVLVAANETYCIVTDDELSRIIELLAVSSKR